MAPDPKEIRLENLVVLHYNSSKYETGVIDLKDFVEYKNENIKIDMNLNSWSYLSWKNVEIGRPRGMINNSGIKQRWGVIGIYDRTINGHLNNMVHDAEFFTADDSQIVPTGDDHYGF